MPSQGLSSDEKAKIKSTIPTSSNKIFFATPARIYYAYPQPNQWSYTGLEGALVFLKDNNTNSFSFRLVDLDGNRGITWEHELYKGFEYNPDKAFFHSFEGDECMIGFVFADEHEAKKFWKKVIANKDSSNGKSQPEKKKKSSKGGKIDKSMISGPKSGSFIHVAHMGYDPEKGFTSEGVDPSWTAFLGSLEDKGIDKEIIAKEMEFIKSFVRENDKGQKAPAKEAKKPKPPPPPRRSHVQNDSTSSDQVDSPVFPLPTRSHPEPPLRTQPPPPPVTPAPPKPAPPLAMQTPSSPPPTPPAAPRAPPRRPPPQTSAPPPPPTRPAPPSTGAAPPPPRRPPNAAPSRPPPPPARVVPSVAEPQAESDSPVPPPVPPPAPPPPPPPPPPPAPSNQTGAPAPPPPPPPPPPVGNDAPAPPAIAGVPAPQPGRGDLLASIAGKGVHSLRKTDPSASPARGTPPPPTDAGSSATAAAGGATAASGGGGGDLTSALAAALLERNKRLGDSDEEDEDDEDWD